MRAPLGASLLLLAASCVSYVPRPLDPGAAAAAFEQRSLGSPAVRTAAERIAGHPIEPWPPAEWNLDLLTAAAFELNPKVAVARAAYESARAAIVTSGERPGASATTSVEHKSEPRPWVTSFGVDLTLELPAKRRARRDLAIHSANAALVRVSDAAWEARGRIRAHMLDTWAAGRRLEVLGNERRIDLDIVELFEKRVELGEAAQLELSRARIAAAQAAMLETDARRMSADGVASIAADVGVPYAELKPRTLDFAIFSETAPAFGDELRKAALTARPDIRAALLDYAAAEDALRLEIARQYPDLHFAPAFGWDQGARTWALALTADPLNRHRGPIGEAMARRNEAAARFVELQAGVIAALDHAAIALESAKRKLAEADAIVASGRSELRNVSAQFNAGEADRLALRSMELELAAAELNRIDAAVELQQAIGMLEDAVGQPLAGSVVNVEKLK